MQNESEKGREPDPDAAGAFGAHSPDQASTQEGREFQRTLRLTYFVPCVIGTLRSLSLPIMSSADVSGFTIFSI
jgi:hypothetical protein